MDSEQRSEQHVRVGNAKFEQMQWFTDVVPRRRGIAAHFSPQSCIHVRSPYGWLAYNDNNQNLAAQLERVESCPGRVAFSDPFSIFRAEMLGQEESLGSIGIKRMQEARVDVLWLYRLLDVYSFMQGDTVSVERPSTMASVSYSAQTPLGTLNELAQTLNTFTKGLQHHLELVYGTSRGVEVDHFPHCSDHLLSLYAELVHREAKKDVLVTLMNITIAAIHVGLILKGHYTVPGDWEGVGQLIVKNGSDSDRAAIQTLTRRGSFARQRRHFCNPLDLALTISPLLLLLPRQYKNIGGRDYLMDTWAALGSVRRPPELCQAEQALWRVIFATASGGNLLDQLSTSLPALIGIASTVSEQWISIYRPSAIKKSDFSTAISHQRQGTLPSENPQKSESHPQDSAPAKIEITSASPHGEPTNAHTSAEHSHHTENGDPQEPAAPGPASQPAQESDLNGQDSDGCPEDPQKQTGARIERSQAIEQSGLGEDREQNSGEPEKPAARSQLSDHPAAESGGPLEESRAPEESGLGAELEISEGVAKISGGASQDEDEASEDEDGASQESDDASEECDGPAAQSKPPGESQLYEESEDSAEEREKSGDGSENFDAAQDSVKAHSEESRAREDSEELSDDPESLGDRSEQAEAAPKSLKEQQAMTRNRGSGYNLRDVKPAQPGYFAEVTPAPGLSGGKRKRKGRGKVRVMIDLTIDATDVEDASCDKIDLDVASPRHISDTTYSLPIPASSQSKPEDSRYEYRPEYHLAQDLQWFEQMEKHVLPPPAHQSQVADFIEVIPHWQYARMGSAEILSFLKTRACIVVTGAHYEEVAFCEETLSSLFSLDEVTTLHDFTILGPGKTRSGTLLDLLAGMRADPPKALNCLYMPETDDAYAKLPYSTDSVAWKRTRGHTYCGNEELYPISDMRWSIASTGATTHYWHIDSDGFGTFIQVETGCKLWYVATPKSGSFDDFASTELYTGDYDISATNHDRWNIVRLVLTPGTTLIMRPNLPHAVATPEPTICRGGHFYCTSTIKDTVAGIFHNFVGQRTVTNTEHRSASHRLLTRMLTFYVVDLTEQHQCVAYFLLTVSHHELKAFIPILDRNQAHLPDACSWEGVLSILYLCLYFELYSALVHWHYLASRDAEALKSAIKNRARARKLLSWLFENHTFTRHGQSITGKAAQREIYSRLLVHHARLLVIYKNLAHTAGLECHPDEVKPQEVAQYIDWCLRGGPSWELYNLTKSQPITHRKFSWDGKAYSVISTPQDDHGAHLPFETCNSGLKPSVTEMYDPLDGYVYGDWKCATTLGFALRAEHAKLFQGFSDDLSIEEEYSDSDDTDADTESSDSDEPWAARKGKSNQVALQQQPHSS
ncbi:hypothetical protein C0989_008562 [Termitomyces sp. Mn162]|nr:hypothetical protein C0989_008562 [Termitomyces sp. Mn162]